MKKCKRLLIFLFACSFVLGFNSFCFSNIRGQVFADNIINSIRKVYRVFSVEGKFLMEKEGVNKGDEFLTRNFEKYKIILVDEEGNVAVAEFLGCVEKPKVDFGFSSRYISADKPLVALYMTHNDESYVPTDKVSSVYGAGGIHDVAKKFAADLEKEGIATIVDETLHIPHDGSAYSRSKKTAQSLISEHNPDCLFDIHRDGASRKTYVKNVDGKERCGVRIVVGKASENYKSAEKLALYLLAVADEICDWLFVDIYYATGHYNQGLHNRSLLFELGSHLVEKELVLDTTSQLAKVVNVAFFNTTVDKETGDMTINGEITEQTPTINQLFAEKVPTSKKFENEFVKILIVTVAGGLTLLVVCFAGDKLSKKK